VGDPNRRIVLRAEVRIGARLIVTHTLELGADGCFVQSDERPPVGMATRVRLSFPGLVDPVEVPARVGSHRPAPAPGEPTGVQLLFDHARGQDAARLEALLLRVRMAPPLFDPRRPGYRVLLVDDSGLIRDLFSYGMRKYFNHRRSSVTVDVVDNGMDAWEKLAADRYDLAIVDHHLSETTGSELIARLREESRHLALPIIAISGGGLRAREAALAAGADLFLDKPLVLRELFATLDRLTATLRS
jgi:CheY-like chemotaxis protein